MNEKYNYSHRSLNIKSMVICYLSFFLLFVGTPLCVSGDLGLPPIDPNKQTKLPPCRACKIFVESFKKGLERTSKFKFEGGDAAWEEENLGSYANSEVRFVEIHEKLCSEVVDGKEQCYLLAEEYEEKLEEWWFKKQKEEPDLHKFICIDTFEVCCPDLHFGKNCTPCEGFPDNVCFNNGKCKGAGTRKGDGKCHCDQGYMGDYCNACANNFFETYKDENKILCSKCHISCDGKCTKAGHSGCIKCKPGWKQDKERGCMDVNECITNNPCTSNQFCVNTEGSYRCVNCHKSCATCTGDGPDMCTKCAFGFKKKKNLCIDMGDEGRKWYVSLTRYLTYAGLCICICIILNKNICIAAIVGVCVAIYITVSEYVIHSGPAPKNDISEQVAEQLMRAFQ